MSKIWKLIYVVQVQHGPEGSFIFIFEDVKERDEVLEEEPWLLDNNLLILKKWPPNKSFQALDFSTIGFWLQVHGLPPINWNQQNAQKIGQLFGGLICVDNVQGPSQEWHPFLRLKVRILVEKPILTGFFIAQGGEKKDWIKFKYERLPIFCFCCGIIGHIARNCNGKLNGDIAPPSRFGMGLYLAACLLNTQSIPASSPPSDPSTHINCPGTKKQSLTAAESVGVTIGLEEITLLKDLHAKGKDLCSLVFLNPSFVVRLTREQTTEIISMGLKRDRPTSSPQPSQNTTCSKASSLWALRERDDQINLARLQIKKQKLLDPAIVAPKPLDFLLHPAASLLKPKRIITSPNAHEIATILNIDESSNLFPQKDSATDSFLMIESTAGHNSRNLESLLPEDRVLKIPNFPPASKTQKSTWKCRARAADGRIGSNSIHTKKESAVVQPIDDVDNHLVATNKDVSQSSKALVASQKPPQSP
ncbi:hypothetical protein GH714_038342 [Hevea brasiliensis]|uniref:CCHC-type domain-containing protein n=1 Tax=Hevea brasiliensis TaxID=3981 RepID=A0A6A6L8W2_HEVBR|nr:hypothetical protein GH714_038342 [Hevea brasiliensis]